MKISVIFFIFLFLYSCNNLNQGSHVTLNQIADTTALSQPLNHTFIFGIPADSYLDIHRKIPRNKLLSQILSVYGIREGQIDTALRNSPGVFDIRKIRSNANYTILSDKDSNSRARYFIYEHEPSLFYIFSFNDSLKITPYREQVRTEIRFSTGTIKTSLWDAVINSGLSPDLPVYLSDIYAWTVDFFGLQKGDRFKVVYKEQFIGTRSIGISRIYGAEFDRSGTRLYAIPMYQDGSESYYDSTGNSLRKAFLKSPLKFSRISSRFSSGRMHPILRIVRPHYGVDYAAPAGTPVHSIGDGTVLSVGMENESGRIVRIKHNSVYTTAYMHLSSFGNNLYPGAKVKQDDIVGYVGSSGLATGPHLDFRFYKNGYAVDPLRVDAPAVEPVKLENMEKFNMIRSVVISLLGTIE